MGFTELFRQSLFYDLAVNHKPGEIRQTFGDAVLLAGLAPDGPAHPALGGGVDRVLQVGACVQFVQNVVGKVAAVTAVEEGAD